MVLSFCCASGSRMMPLISALSLLTIASGDFAEEIFRADMRTSADTGAAIGEVFAALDEVSEVLCRIAGMNGENVRAERHDGDGAQIVGRKPLVPGGGLVDRERGRRGKNGMAVG